MICKLLHKEQCCYRYQLQQWFKANYWYCMCCVDFGYLLCALHFNLPNSSGKNPFILWEQPSNPEADFQWHKMLRLISIKLKHFIWNKTFFFVSIQTPPPRPQSECNQCMFNAYFSKPKQGALELALYSQALRPWSWLWHQESMFGKRNVRQAFTSRYLSSKVGWTR